MLGWLLFWIEDFPSLLKLVVLIYLCHSWYIMTQLDKIKEMWEIYFVLVNFLLTDCVRELNMSHMRKVFQHKLKKPQISLVVNIWFSRKIWSSFTSNEKDFFWIYSILLYTHTTETVYIYLRKIGFIPISLSYILFHFILLFHIILPLLFFTTYSEIFYYNLVN